VDISNMLFDVALHTCSIGTVWTLEGFLSRVCHVVGLELGPVPTKELTYWTDVMRTSAHIQLMERNDIYPAQQFWIVVCIYLENKHSR